MARRRGWGGFAPYQSVAGRRQKAERFVKRERKAGRDPKPVVIEGRQIATTFWGQAWCDNLERYSDYETRLPRGRTYARNGSVVDLGLAPGRIEAKVLGSELYAVVVEVAKLPDARWKAIIDACEGRVDSLLSLLRGQLSDQVMAVVTRPQEGLFPHPGELAFDCTCPDWAFMCKHIAAVLYGVGSRLDDAPEQLFALRGVDPQPLLDEVVTRGPVKRDEPGRHKRLERADLSTLFGVPIEDRGARVAAARKRRAKRAAQKK